MTTHERMNLILKQSKKIRNLVRKKFLESSQFLTASLRVHWMIVFGKVNSLFYTASLRMLVCLFKYTPVFFKWMFLQSIKEINRLINTEISNIYLNSSHWKLTFSKLWFSKFEKLVSRSVFEELQFKQTSLSFKTSCYNF